MTSQTCPRCGGTLEATVLGDLHDKHQRCGHCGHLIDVLDEYEMTRTEEDRTAGGGHRRVTTTVRRTDLGPGRPGEAGEQLDLTLDEIEMDLSIDGAGLDGGLEDLERMVREQFGVSLGELEAGKVHEVRKAVHEVHRSHRPEVQIIRTDTHATLIDHTRALKLAVVVIVILVLVILFS